MYDWDFLPFSPYLVAFAKGSSVTIYLALFSSLVGTVLGAIGAMVLRHKVFGPWLLPINDAFRAIPMLVLLFFFFYFPYQEALGIQPLDELSAALAALTFSQTAFTADLVRAALNNVSPDITLAGRALGLKSHIIMLKLVLPDVLRQILPTLVAFYIGNIKLSSLASVLGCRELVFVAKVAMGQTYRALEAWSIVGLIYIVMIVPLAWVSRKLESSTWIKRRS